MSRSVPARATRYVLLVSLAASIASGAAAAPDITIGQAMGAPGQVVSVPVTFTSLGTVTAMQADIVFDPDRLAAGAPTEGAALAGTDHELDSNLVAAGRLRIIVLSQTVAALPSGVIANLAFTIQPVAAAGATALTLEGLEIVDDTPAVVPPTATTAGNVVVEAAACVPGDIHPDGVGNSTLSLADFVLGRRKILGVVAQVARDVQCADVHPGVVTCDAAAGADSFCPAGNDLFQLADVIVMRRLLLEVQHLSCAACAPQLLASDWIPADVAPRGRRDGRVDIGDVVMMLRFAVGLDQPSADDALRADVAPAQQEGAVKAVQGDGLVNIGDVVLSLRASVGLETLVWKQRELVVQVVSPVSFVAVMAAASGWPSWAGVDEGAAECTGGAESGIDASGDRVGLTCVSDPVVLNGPADVATLRYRAPKAVDPATLALRSELIDASLETVPGAVRLTARN